MDLVTGGAGFIGSHLVEELVARGRQVRVLDNFTSGKDEYLEAVGKRVEVIRGDILDSAIVRAAMAGVQRVFHQAALRSVPRSVDDPAATNRVNVEGTLNVLVAARDAGVQRVVYASSSSAYGNSQAMPLREDQPPAPVSPYAVSKLAGEYYCRVFTRVYGLPTVALRYFNVFGPRQDPNGPYAAVIPRFLLAALHEQSLEIHGDGLQSRDFTFVQNVVQANCLAADSPDAVGEVFNVACGRQQSLQEIVALIGHALPAEARPIRWHHTPARPGDVRHTRADIGRAKRLLGYRVIVDFAEGLRQTLEALRMADAPTVR
jgi:UDP-glucose 4-epimerase